MRQYTISEAIEDMKNTIQVFSEGYGTWKVNGYLGLRSTGECAEDYFTTHDESWKTGSFDGETYNPQDYDEWLENYFEPEFEGVSRDALALITDDMKEEMFKTWCETLWSDSANEDNYEPTEHRNRRIAEEIFWSWEHEESPENIFINREKDIVIVLTDDEFNFVAHKADEGNDSYFECLCDGCTTKFVNDYDPDWDSEG